jgi:hypothetical protein
MRQLSEHRAQTRIGWALGAAAAALLCVIALSQANLAYAGPHGGGGGFHGGGFHGGRFHGGGFHGGGFHGRGFAGFHGHGFHGIRPGFSVFYYPYYGYYDYGQPPSSQTWYCCSDPEGYYPYIAQCNTGWQTVPAS